MNIRDYDAEDILGVILGAGTCDVKYFLNKLNDFDLDFEDIFEEVKSYGRERDFNAYVYETFNLAGNTFIDAVKEYVNDFEEELCEMFTLSSFDKSILENFEINIFVNYLDSSFDCILENYDVSDLSEENFIKFIEELYQLEALAS